MLSEGKLGQKCPCTTQQFKATVKNKIFQEITYRNSLYLIKDTYIFSETLL